MALIRNVAAGTKAVLRGSVEYHHKLNSRGIGASGVNRDYWQNAVQGASLQINIVAGRIQSTTKLAVSVLELPSELVSVYPVNCGKIRVMNEQDPESRKRSQSSDSETLALRESELFHGSGQSQNIEPGDGFVAPKMALDEFEPDAKD